MFVSSTQTFVSQELTLVKLLLGLKVRARLFWTGGSGLSVCGLISPAESGLCSVIDQRSETDRFVCVM